MSVFNRSLRQLPFGEVAFRPSQNPGTIVKRFPFASHSIEESSVMPTVKFVKEKVTVEVQEGQDLRSVARKNGVEIYAGPHKVLNCLGNGLCGSCDLVVKSGSENCGERTFRENFVAKWLTPLPLFLLKILSNPDKEVRLACQTTVKGDMEIETNPGINWHGEKFWN